MSFHRLMVKAADRAHNWLHYTPGTRPSVCELGNQKWRGDGAVAGREGYASTKDFYLDLGFERYLAIDVNTAMDAVAIDLNRLIFDVARGEDYNEPLFEAFDLVTNNGTGEHIFNQAAVFENMHDLCKVGGLMLHCLPCWGWPNHGFYTFNPLLFRDLAAANSYEWAFLWLGSNKGLDTYQIDVATDEWVWSHKSEQLQGLFRGNVSIVACLRKTVEADFRLPIQGKYLKSIESDEIKARYA